MQKSFYILIIVLGALLTSCDRGVSTEILDPIDPTPTPRLISSPNTEINKPIKKITSGGNLNIALRTPILNFDVHSEFSPALASLGPGIIYNRMLRYQSGKNSNSPNLLIECELCSSWTQIDPVTIVFHIRPDVKWQNLEPVNGTKLTVQDIIDSYTRQQTLNWPNAPLLENILEMEATNELTLTMKLRVPDGDFLRSLADGHSKVVPSEVFHSYPNLSDGPTVGSGPWILSEYEKNYFFKFQRNDNYFERNLPYLDTLTVHVIENEDARLAAFRVKLLDIDEFPPKAWNELPDKFRPQHILYKQMSSGIEFGINSKRKPFEDLEFRKSLFAAINPWEANEAIWGGLGQVTMGMPVIGRQWLLPEENILQFFNMPREKPPGSLEIELTVGDFGDTHIDYAKLIGNQLKIANVAPTFRVLNPREYADTVWKKRDYEIYIGPPPPFNTTNSYLLSTTHSLGKYNATGINDSKIDNLIALQLTELDISSRRIMVMEIQRKLIEKAVRFMPYTAVQVWAWWPHVRDFYPNFENYEYAFWSTVWIDKN